MAATFLKTFRQSFVTARKCISQIRDTPSNFNLARRSQKVYTLKCWGWRGLTLVVIFALIPTLADQRTTDFYIYLFEGTQKVLIEHKPTTCRVLVQKDDKSRNVLSRKKILRFAFLSRYNETQSVSGKSFKMLQVLSEEEVPAAFSYPSTVTSIHDGPSSRGSSRSAVHRFPHVPKQSILFGNIIDRTVPKSISIKTRQK